MLNTITMQDIKNATSDKTITEFNGKLVTFLMSNEDFDLANALLEEHESDLQEREMIRRVIKSLRVMEEDLSEQVSRLTIVSIADKLDVHVNEIRKLSKYKYKLSRKDRLAAL